MSATPETDSKEFEVILSDTQSGTTKVVRSEVCQAIELSRNEALAQMEKMREAWSIIETRHAVERNQNDSLVHGTHLTDLDFNTIKNLFILPPPTALKELLDTAFERTKQQIAEHFGIKTPQGKFVLSTTRNVEK